MASQTLDKFRTIFSTDPVRIEFKEFAKDGFTAADVKALKSEGLDAIYLKPLTSAQRADLEASVAGLGENQRDMHNLYARFVAPCWCEPDGVCIGSSKQIGSLRADLVAALFRKVSELNGMGGDAIDDAGKG